MSTRESVYIESASTGRFRRFHEAEDSSTLRWRLPNLPNQNAARRKKDGGLDDKDASKIFLAAFLFLQGILSGLSLSALYEAFSSMQPLDFILHYSATRANEIRRYFFIGISFCATEVLCMLEEDVLTQVLASSKGGSTLSSKGKSDLSLLALYFVAIILHLLCSRIDVQIFSIAAHSSQDYINISYDDIESVVHKWRGYSVPRSLLCIVGWLISCYQFVAAKNTITPPAQGDSREP